VTLWQAAVEFIVKSGVTAEPWGRDKGRVEELFAQLYLLGERPSAVEVRTYMRERWPQQGRHWQDTIVRLWRKRLSKPAHQPASVRRTTGWSYPFTIPEMLAQKHDLGSVGDMLLAALDTAARSYLQAVEEDPSRASGSEVAAIYGLTAQAVRLWALSRDRIEDLPWPSVTKPPRARDNLVVYATNTGREQEGLRIKRFRERDDARREHVRKT
jgi:hypothetical protein